MSFSTAITLLFERITNSCLFLMKAIRDVFILLRRMAVIIRNGNCNCKNYENLNVWS